MLFRSQANRVASVAASQRLDEAIKEQGLQSAVKQGSSSTKNKTLDDWLDESEETGEDDTEPGDEDTESGEEITDSEDDAESDQDDDQNASKALMVKE